MKSGSVDAGAAAWIGAVLSSLCCLLPLAVIALGLGSGAFMAVTMRYRWLFIPAGILGVAIGFALYARERRRCAAAACRMAGSRVTLALLILAAPSGCDRLVGDMFADAQVVALRALGHLSYERLARRAKVLSIALRRVRDGSYGSCEECGRSIAKTRLQALPCVTTCLQCQELREPLRP